VTTITRLPSDDAGAQQRRQGFGRCVALGHGVGVRLGDLDLLGEAAVFVVSREARVLAEVLVAALAVRAGLAGLVQPGEADAVAFLEALGVFPGSCDAADDLVTRHDGQDGERDLPLADMDVGAAEPAALDVDHDFSGIRLGVGQLS
jgi:hypothetical protein